MDTNRIKRFATEARSKLKEGIAAKIITLGFDKKGNVPENLRPQLLQGGSLWNGQLQTEGFYHQWMALYNRVQQKGINEVYEEAAYTWFNRLCAIRILQKNNLCAPILEYADAARTPNIVDEARQGHLPQMKEETRQRLMELLDDDTKVTEQFAVLITAWCHSNPIINKCFGGMADYTELLLPNNILAEGGFVDMLNHTEFITNENYASPELIGWLYQFYISERKDEVFAKKGKFEADEIPAATQIFTPNWIVKYMVQNTVGRIYLDNHPEAASTFKPKWQYLVDNENDNENENKLQFEELTDLVCGDLACGSGHIENEMFDILFDLYMYEGYSRSEAIENIFSHNLVGIDLDLRAKQLATFALLLKACQKDESFADAHCMPNILTMPKPWDEVKDGDIRDFLHHYFQGQENRVNADELADCFDLMQNADSLGSIMKFNISDSTRLLVKQTTEYWCSQEIVPEAISAQIPAFKLILALTEKYHALVMNPPYMGGSSMNEPLAKYIKENYVSGKADLMAVFMIVAVERLFHNGKYGMINMQTWMFNDSFESLRTNLLSYCHIDNMLHLGPRTFEELSGEVVQNTAFVVSNNISTYKAIYYRLTDCKSCNEKCVIFLNENNHTDGKTKLKYEINQEAFFALPCSIIGYWISAQTLNNFTNTKIGEIAAPRQGLATSDNNRFLRLWYEINDCKISFTCKSREESKSSKCKWFPYNKGGYYRKWYGNNEYVINWENDGEELLSFAAKLYGSPTRTIKNIQYYFKESITWSALSGGKISLRFSPSGFLFDTTGQCIFAADRNLNYKLMAFLNSAPSSAMLKIISPTLHFNSGSVARLPYIQGFTSVDVVEKVVGISKQDWDAHETSWDFQSNELVRIANGQFGKLDDFINGYRTEWEGNFDTIHENEEELNRKFIEIYGLQEELTPDVPLSEITILQAGEITHVKDENEYGGGHYVWNYDNLMKQLISYAVGTWMGRYRLDKPGLHIAHPDPTEEEIAPYEYHGEQYEIDDDAIIPLMSNDCGFSDNASLRFSDFIRQVFGDAHHVENLNYVEQCLGKTVEQYFVKDFWKDHKKMYQNRPIYWLFSSKKGAFQVITYMHRMNAYTVERIRAKYLLPYIEHLQEEINRLDMRRAELSTKESKTLQSLQKQLDECREYHDRLQVIAEQAISFDLDDGVVVNYAKFGDVVQKIK